MTILISATLHSCFLLVTIAALALASGSSLAARAVDSLADMDCGNPFENAFGPFDYRTASHGQKQIVEINHFTSQVEGLRAGLAGSLGADIDYTLRVFPNHPRALMSMIRLGQRLKSPIPNGANWTVECYVERGVQYQPDDMDVRLIRGIFRATQGRYKEAIEDYTFVLAKQPNNAQAHYNLGLAYFEVKDYDRAVEEAKAAKALGFSLAGLANKLKGVKRPID